MKTKFEWSLFCAAVLLLSGSCVLAAQDDVTIPKSRLEELERKEAELEKLKGKGAAQPSPEMLPGRAVPVTPGRGAAPVPRPSGPALSSLPPFKEGETVESVDLADYYRQDRAAADKRFHGRKITVRGEIIGFGKPLLRRNYRVVLQGPDRDTKVTCDLLPSEKYSAVFTVDDGMGLAGMIGETKVPIAKVGAIARVEGTCKGLRKGAVFVLGNRMTLNP